MDYNSYVNYHHPFGFDNFTNASITSNDSSSRNSSTTAASSASATTVVLATDRNLSFAPNNNNCYATNVLFDTANNNRQQQQQQPPPSMFIGQYHHHPTTYHHHQLATTRGAVATLCPTGQQQVVENPCNTNSDTYRPHPHSDPIQAFFNSGMSMSCVQLENKPSVQHQKGLL
jgi:hypothetical protein